MLATGLTVSVTSTGSLGNTASSAWYEKVTVLPGVPPVYVNEPSASKLTVPLAGSTSNMGSAVSVSPSGSASLPRTPGAATVMSGPRALTYGPSSAATGAAVPQGTVG